MPDFPKKDDRRELDDSVGVRTAVQMIPRKFWIKETSTRINMLVTQAGMRTLLNRVKKQKIRQIQNDTMREKRRRTISLLLTLGIIVFLLAVIAYAIFF